MQVPVTDPMVGMPDGSDLQAMAGLPGAFLIMGLTQITKPFISDTRFHPLIAIAYGLILNLFIAVGLQSNLYVAVMVGIVAGFSASGIWSAIKTVHEGDEGQRLKKHMGGGDE